MRNEQINEPIEVIAHFAPGKVRPLRFLWKGRAHRINNVRGMWTTLEGRQKCHHFALLVNDVGACEISLDVDKMSWLINSVSIDN